jgi:hypothetical protein
MGERRGSQTELLGKFDGKRPLGRPRLGREDGIKIDLITYGGQSGLD